MLALSVGSFESGLVGESDFHDLAERFKIMCGDIVDLGHLVVDHEEFFLGTGDVVKRFTTVVLVIDDDAVEREFFLGTIMHVHVPIFLEEREPRDVTQITKLVRRRVLVHAQVLELDCTQELVQMIQI